MSVENLINIELVFATAEKQQLSSVTIKIGTTAREAIVQSGLASEFPSFDFSRCPLGIWGRPVADERILAEGDRLEAYRQLRRDPREARRELARTGRHMGSTS